MGYSILELVLRRLRQAGFRADAAYPGQKYPQIGETVATAHIEKVDRANLTVTMEVSIISPAATGGTACEVEALRATEILRWAGAVCVQNGCTYDGVSQVYVVSILATFTGTTDEEACVIWPGFYCYVDGALQRFATNIRIEEVTGRQVEFQMGEVVPMGVSDGCHYWNIELEEVIPAGSAVSAEPGTDFTIQLITDEKTEEFSGCTWLSASRVYSKEGLRRIHKGVALGRKEVTNG
ncbi:MAG: hypothetical protein Q4F81_08205 [Eubacteriales bacterium]|nr:hypothetical protein [Eubacteriales bacterium]